VTWKNFLLVGNFLSIATCFNISAAGADCVIDQCEFRDTSDVLGFLSCITALSTAGLTVKNCRRNSIAATTPGALVVVTGALARCNIIDSLMFCGIDSTNAPMVLDHGALVLTDLLVARNRVYCVNANSSGGALLVRTSAITGSGIICDNYIRSQDPAGAILVTATAVQYSMFNNLHTGETTLLSATLLPAAGSDT
jgi:hypothetical protein